MIDGDRGASAEVAASLGGQGFAVDVLQDGSSPVASNPAPYDMVLLDVVLPGQSGFDLLKRIRARLDVPVLLLGTQDSETDRVVGFELGADDFVTRPTSLRELAARIRAILRRSRRGALPVARTCLQVGEVRLEPASRLAWQSGQPLDLTTAEFNLLEVLLSRAGLPVGREELTHAAFGYPRGACGDRNVDNLVYKLRRKLGGSELIRTLRNVGYLYAARSAGQGA